MHIVFNCFNSGLANNGGSRTILLSAKVLKALGHKCDIAAVSDRFTWFEHDRVVNVIPRDADVVVATACTTVDSTLVDAAPKKAWYIRGHETWVMPENKLAVYYNSGLINIVNSKGLQNKLSEVGAFSEVVYPGIDTELWYDQNTRSKGKIRIGCLYNKKPTKRWNDFIKLASLLGNKKYEFIGVGDSPIEADFLTEYTYNVRSDKLREIYSKCDIWFSPTELEGLHNVPIEAALCGCLVVCSDAPMNGMIHDYAFNNETAMVYPVGDLNAAASLVDTPNWKLVPKMQNFLINEIGDRKKNMTKFVKVLES